MLKQRPLYQDVSDLLREMIYKGKLSPGDWIDETALCDELGVSRTPLREALKVLQLEELIELVPRRGCRVNDLDTKDLLDLFPVMASLEGMCAQLAVKHMRAVDLKKLEKYQIRLEDAAAKNDVDGYYKVNKKIHTAIQELSGNRWLNSISAQLRNVLLLARHHQLTVPGRLQESLEEHRQLLQAFRDKDADEAGRIMSDHLLQQEKVLRKSAL
ncbi:MAG: GntR family transcriptional regulator [Oceanospirillaceae bacterium]